MDLMYGISAFDRSRGNFPDLPVINMYAEEAPSEAKVSLQSRPGLADAAISFGSGPVRQLFKQSGVINDRLFAVSGSGFYNDIGLMAEIDGDDYVSMAGYEDAIFACGGEGIWYTDGTTVTEVEFPDEADVSKIVIGASRLVAIRKDTQTFYWSDPLTSTIDGLSFATAESSPDLLLDVLFYGDRLILFGAETVEFWPIFDDPDLPFAPLVGRVYSKGVKATGCATLHAGSFAWVTDQNQICLDNPDNILTTPDIEEKIKAETTPILWTFFIEGDEFLALRLPITQETWVRKARSGQWSQFESYGYENWLPTCYADNYLGSAENGAVYVWGDDYEDLGAQLERRFRAWMPIDTGNLVVNNLYLRTNPGQTPYLEGDYMDPRVEMRTSKDGGFAFGPWRQRSMGEQGMYRIITSWLACGNFAYPGVLAEFRVTDPVPFRVSSVVINNPYGTL